MLEHIQFRAIIETLDIDKVKDPWLITLCGDLYGRHTYTRIVATRDASFVLIEILPV